MNKLLMFKHKGSSLYNGANELWLASEGLLFPVEYGSKIANASVNDEILLMEIFFFFFFNFNNKTSLKENDELQKAKVHRKCAKVN